MTANPTLGADMIETTDEDGNVHVFEKVDEYEFDGQRYALLIYQPDGTSDEDSENGHTHAEDCEHDGYDEEIVVMKVGMEDGAQVFEAIEDEDEFNRVVQEIERLSLADDDDAEGNESDEDFDEAEMNRDD